MKYLALLALAFTMNAHATGGFDCVGNKANGEKVEIFGTTGHVVGNPLVSDVFMTVGNVETAQVFPRNQVVGYWNMGRQFKLAITDDNAMEIVVKLIARYKRNSPDMKGKLTLPGGEVVKVKCVAE
ncbi:hypothetical protein OAT67_02510 [Bacteriovoracaceae bacterium]|nr:hypothetical protein [Bacteriovoracaceae bacterium]